MKKLIVIDPHVVASSPSMRGWIGAIPAFRDLFDEIEIWASECELGTEQGVTWKKIPRRLPTWQLHALDFQYQVNRRLRNKSVSRDTLVQVTGCYAKKADIRYMHFWNCALLDEMAKRPENLKLNPIKRLGTELAAHTERKIVADENATKWWWVVSKSISERIASQSTAGEFCILPNQYDPLRFNGSVRVKWREPMRSHYGVKADEKLLVFCAFGSFARKGLIQAIQCLELLREKKLPIRLLILGGSHRTVNRFIKSLTPQQMQCCVFAGLVDNIERHLVAADGFFFPSHFEAFSLAEIEAAALGLRLYLTPHCGSEMILRDPINGRLLPWEPKGMATIIEKEFTDGVLGQPHHEMGEALTKVQYDIRLRELYQRAIENKLSEKD